MRSSRLKHLAYRRTCLSLIDDGVALRDGEVTRLRLGDVDIGCREPLYPHLRIVHDGQQVDAELLRVPESRMDTMG